MKQVKLFLTLLAIVFMVSACELSPGEIEPISDELLYYEPTHDGGDMGGETAPPPPLEKINY